MLSKRQAREIRKGIRQAQYDMRMIKKHRSLVYPYQGWNVHLSKLAHKSYMQYTNKQNVNLYLLGTMGDQQSL